MEMIQLKKFLTNIKSNIPLKDYTTFKIGGPARYFLKVKTKDELTNAVKLAKKLNSPFFILAGGSNLIVSDEGYDGLVIKILNTKYKILNTKVQVEAGANLGQVVLVAAKSGLEGMEWAMGIPGTVGGAVHGNAGTPKESMKDIVKEVEVLDAKDLRFKIYDLRDCKFGYRDSVFKHQKNLIILSAVLELKKGDKEKIKEKMKKFILARKEKQPLEYPSAGSIFKNFQFSCRRKRLPGGLLSKFQLLEKFPEIKEAIKDNYIPAGWLIEKCGLKGKRIGNVQISEKHANFIVNLGNGKAKNVKELINLIKKKVKNKLGIELEEEIQCLNSYSH